MLSPRIGPMTGVVLLAVTLFVAGCSSDPDNASIEGQRAGDLATRPIQGLTVTSSPIGPVVADDLGYVLYGALGDSETNPTCADRDCLALWPPVTPAAGLDIGPGVADRLVATVDADDGAVVVFNSRPLHRFAGEQGPGSTDGCGIAGRWYPLSADGDPVRDCS